MSCPDFYSRNVVEVAKDLLGKRLSYGNHSGIITETEAYGGYDDEASHGFRGKTKRSEIMFGPAGHIYVYMIYGMYYCLNIVTGKQGEASAVLIRGLLLPNKHLNGPGKLCKHLGINKELNGLNLLNSNIFNIENSMKNVDYISTPRIGINKAVAKPWRFVITP